MFSLLLKTRIKKNNATKFRISSEEKNEETILRIEDNGEKISEKAIRELTEGVYNGETSGIGGPVYFAFREIVKNLRGKFQVKHSDLGGARFDVQLQKSES